MSELIDLWYRNRDPWAYETTPDDAKRKSYILHILELFGPFSKALDIGAGEGWITKDLPALVKHGYELSDVAAARFPPTVRRELDGKYDLVTATGVLYAQYAWESLVKLINEHATGLVLTCNIKSWEIPSAIHCIHGTQILDMEFPYREFTQKLRVFQVG